jgi:hypothetical protein
VSEKVIAGLGIDNRVELSRIPNGTNIFSLRVKRGDPRMFQDQARKAGVVLGDPQGDRFLLSVNETWNRASPQQILDRLQQSLT